MHKNILLQNAGIDRSGMANSDSTADESPLGVGAVMWTGLAKVQRDVAMELIFLTRYQWTGNRFSDSNLHFRPILQEYVPLRLNEFFIGIVQPADVFFFEELRLQFLTGKRCRSESGQVDFNGRNVYGLNLSLLLVIKSMGDINLHHELFAIASDEDVWDDGADFPFQYHLVNLVVYCLSLLDE